MPKPRVTESRFDFRGGRVSAISPDLLNANELVDATNTRLVNSYGAFGKRLGSQRIHPDALTAAIRGVTQWDISGGKQIVAIANGKLYYRDGFDYSVAFQQATTAATQRTTAALDLPAVGSRGWTDPDGTDNGRNTLTVAINAASQTVAAGSRLTNRIGVTAFDDFPDAADDLYNFSFKVIADGTGITGTYAAVTSDVQVEYAINGGAFTLLPTVYRVSTSLGNSKTTQFDVTIEVAGAPTRVDFRLQLTVYCVGSGAGNGVGHVQCFSTVYKTDNFPVTWVTGAAQFSLTDPAFFMPFRASTAGAPLVLYIASGGHYFKWDGATSLTQLDPTNSAPLAKLIMSYHTRMFALDRNFPKHIFWSEIGDAEDFTGGDKTKGGSAVVDFLTGQELLAMEVIGSSLLLATEQSVIRFTGQASDDIVIAQGTEGITSEVGVVGPQALKRFENVAAMLTNRGVYAVTETHVEPISEQIIADIDALDTDVMDDSVIQYDHGDRQLLIAVPRTTDAGLNKTIFAQAVRLQAWQGPWIYPFAITCMTHYHDGNGAHFVLAGCTDGFVRILGVGNKDDVLYDGTSGSNITMTAELPPLHFGHPGVVKSLDMIKLQAKLPSGHNLKVQTAFDGGSLSDAVFIDTIYDGTLRDYRLDTDDQGKRCRVVFTDTSAVSPTIHGLVLHAHDMQRP